MHHLSRWPTVSGFYSDNGFFERRQIMSAQNKVLVRRVVDELWNRGIFEIIDEAFDPDYCHFDPGNSAVCDLDSFRSYVEMMHTAFPDLHVEISDMIAEGDSVAKLWKMQATFKSHFFGIPANNRPISLSGITVYRLAGGKIKECVWGYDSLGLLQQMGVIPVEVSTIA
jgi:steroid delta-isomerase-like uncharacterized protein